MPEPNDNTRVEAPRYIEDIPMSEEYKRQRIWEQIMKNTSDYLYDTDKAKYYSNMQNNYNQNAFGYGISGVQTRFDPTTQEGQRAIQSNFDYAKNNAKDFYANIIFSGAGGVELAAYNKYIRGAFPSKGGYLGTLKQYSKNPIGEGAEAIVINNTPHTVGKMTSIPAEKMAMRNQVPNTLPSQYIGYVKSYGEKLPTYIQRKVKILTEETFPKYVQKLDKSMEKYGFRRVDDPNVQYRAYTDGQVVVDDVAPGNVGLDWLGRPKMIDFSVQTIPEWLEQGFRLKDGGRLINNSKNNENNT